MKYTGQKTKNISFPIGGIGTGCIGLSGNGEVRALHDSFEAQCLLSKPLDFKGRLRF